VRKSIRPAAVDLLTKVCVLTALGREKDLERFLRGPASKVPVADLKEAVLQTYLFAGFPRAINGLWAIDDVFGDAAVWRERAPKSASARGERLCRRIYGRDYDPMMRRMRRLHPDLAEWILVEGYGKTLSRSRFDARLREMLVIPVLVALEAWRQLPSHLLGLIHVGGAAGDVATAIRSARGLVPAGALRQAESLWKRARLKAGLKAGAASKV